MRISRSVLAAVLAGGGAVGLAGGFAVAGLPAGLAGQPAGVARAAGAARPATPGGAARPATPAGAQAALAALLRPAAMTPGDPIFMFINGINGESQDARHPMWSDLTGYHVDFSRATSARGPAGRAQLGSFVVTMPYSLAVPPLLKDLVSGTVLPAVKVQAATAVGDAELNYLTITLGNVRVAALKESSSGERPAETVTFAATRFDVSYTAQHPDGSPGRTETFCFNFALQRTC